MVETSAASYCGRKGVTIYMYSHCTQENNLMFQLVCSLLSFLTRRGSHLHLVGFPHQDPPATPLKYVLGAHLTNLVQWNNSPVARMTGSADQS